MTPPRRFIGSIVIASACMPASNGLGTSTNAMPASPESSSTSTTGPGPDGLTSTGATATTLGPSAPGLDGSSSGSSGLHDGSDTTDGLVGSSSTGGESSGGASTGGTDGGSSGDPPPTLLFYPCFQEDLLMSTEYDIAVDVPITNGAETERQLFWLNYDGEREFVASIGAGESTALASFVTHPIVVTDAQGMCLTIFVVIEGEHDLVLE